MQPCDPVNADGHELTQARSAVGRRPDRAPAAAAPPAAERRSVVLHRSLRADVRRWRDGHGRAAAPPYRAADRDLADGGQRAAPGQPRQRADDQARPAQPDDRGARDRPCRGVTGGPRSRAARRAAVGGAARRRPDGRACLRAPRRAAVRSGGRPGHHRPARIAGRPAVTRDGLLRHRRGGAGRGGRREAAPGARSVVRARRVRDPREPRG